MFEAVIVVTAAIHKGEDGQMAFQVYEDEMPQSDLLSLLAITYYQDIYRLLQEGDMLSVTIRLAESEHTITAYFLPGSEGPVFEELGYASTPDLFPRIKKVYQDIENLFSSSETLSVTFYLKRC